MNFNPQTMSAIAAGFSALSAIVVMRIQRFNFTQETKPVLILEGFNYKVEEKENGKVGLVFVNRIKNIGKGAALNPRFVAFDDTKTGVDGNAQYFMSSWATPVFAAGAEFNINRNVMILWEAVKGDENNIIKQLELKLKISALDIKGNKQITVYNMKAFLTENGMMVGSDMLDVPNLILSQRVTRTISARMLKIFGYLSKLPKVGGYFRRSKILSS